MFAAIQIPDDWTPDLVRGALGAGFHIGPVRSLGIVFLDTFDWRLATRGARLWHESASDRRVLRWSSHPDHPTYTIPVDNQPLKADDLPDGILKTTVAPLLGHRALTDAGSCRIRRHVAGIRDRHGNSRVHIYLERINILAPSGKPFGSRLSLARVSGLPGLERPFNHAVDRLSSLHPHGKEQVDLLEIAVAARGRTVGDYSSRFRLTLSPGQSSESALRSIHLELLGKVLANVDGTVRDLDIEFLHDLRVACRRTRSALTKVKGVFPKNRIAPFTAEFKWLGQVTGPCRDLDVQLRDIERHQRAHPKLKEPLEPILHVIENARARAQEDVSAALRSARFKELTHDWEVFLRRPAKGNPPARAGRPIRETASYQILKAHRRVVQRGECLGENPPADTMHRLRIDAKNLRYLLEFFRSLYAEKKVDRLIKELKVVQNALGTINDMHVQQDRLQEFAQELSSTRGIQPTTLSAVKHMAAACKERQKRARRNFKGHVETLISPASRDRYTSLFETEV